MRRKLLDMLGKINFGKKKPDFVGELLEKVWSEVGARPTLICFSVLLKKGESLPGSVYLIPENRETYGNLEAAKRDLQENNTLYEVKVRRIE